MTENITLKAKKRTKEDEKPKEIRKEGLIPAVLYGSKFDNQNLKIKLIDFEKAYHKAGESNLIDLSIDDDVKVKVIIKEFQKDPMKNVFTHVDFYQVDMNKKIRTEIPFIFIGESKAVKELGGMLIKSMDSVEVECLPGNLVNDIKIDLSSLNNFNDSIKIEDIKFSEGMNPVSEINNTVVSVVEMKAEIKEEEDGNKEVEDDKKDSEEKNEKKVVDKK